MDHVLRWILDSLTHLYVFIITFDVVGDWSVFKFGFWASRLLVNLAWIPTILSSARLASSRRRSEVVVCHVVYFLFLFASCYLCCMLFKLPGGWIPSLVTCIVSMLCIKPAYIVDTTADNPLAFAKEHINGKQVIKLIILVTLSSFMLSSSSWFGFRFILRLLLINAFNVSLIHAISTLVEYYLCSVSLSFGSLLLGTERGQLV